MNDNAKSPLAVQMLGITKKFPGVIANNNVDFEVRRGEVHTLLGENGAGKSTLMQVLSGLYQPNAGEIMVQGQKVNLKSPRDSMDAGIGMVYQRFMLVKKHTVVENVILGLQEFGAVINYRKAIKKIQEISQEYGLEIDPNAHIWNLSIGEQQRVEIVKMLFRNVEILILDEPTAVLTPQEATELFNTVRVLTSQGKSIIFISHKLNEVMEISDRITILRKGEKVTTILKEDTDERGLANLMVGREVLLDIHRETTATEEAVLTVTGVSAIDDRFLPALQGVNFRVHKGEILGLAGVSGNGQRELEQVLTGIRQPTSGTVILGDKEIAGLSPGEIIQDGMACIPSDRHGVGTVPALDFMTNIILKTYRYPPIASGIFLNYHVARKESEKLQEKFDIKVPSRHAPVRLLSGGNLQKVIIARELTSNPKFLLAVHPTRGLDIGATEYVRQQLEKLKRQGVAILLISEDLEELITLSDRVAAIYEGKITGTIPARDATIEKLGLLMTGQAI